MVDHDKCDFIQWIQSGETLRAEEKPYEPWLQAMQERLQKPQLVVATRGNWGGLKPHGTDGSPSEEGKRTSMKVVGAEEDCDTRIEKASERHVRSDVAISYSFNTQ